MGKTAVIIGVSSQDGSYLADLLLGEGYDVVGTIRRNTSIEKENIAHLYGHMRIVAADLLDAASISSVLEDARPDEVYNMAAQSVPADSWSHPMYTGETTGLGFVRVAEAVRRNAPAARLYQATSREIFGNIQADFADETTPVDPNNPYGIAKAYAHLMVRCYRESYQLFVCGGILFNHESPRRSLHFVTRKVTAAAACISNGAKKVPIDELGRPLVDENGKLHLGLLDARRDWGFAGDYVVAMWKMMQQPTPTDYVIGTGKAYSVRDLCQHAFSHVGLDWRDHVVSDRDLTRPTEIKELKADSSKAMRELGWCPRTTFEDLIAMMVEADLQRF